MQVVHSLFEESLKSESFSSPSHYVTSTARGKADEVLGRLSSDGVPADLIIAADTCVVIDGEIFGKPKNKTTTINMLTKLSGRSHDVITGVCLKYRRTSKEEGEEEWRTVEFHEKTIVRFADLSLQLIEAYADTEEPFDKAGGYGIQGLGGTLIEGIEGDYYNIVGFPLHKFCAELVPIIAEWQSSCYHFRTDISRTKE